MTDQELEKAAKEYAWRNGFKESDGCEFKAGANWQKSRKPVGELEAYVRTMQDTLRALTLKMQYGMSSAAAIAILESEIEHAERALSTESQGGNDEVNKPSGMAHADDFERSIESLDDKIKRELLDKLKSCRAQLAEKDEEINLLKAKLEVCHDSRLRTYDGMAQKADAFGKLQSRHELLREALNGIRAQSTDKWSIETAREALSKDKADEVSGG